MATTDRKARVTELASDLQPRNSHEAIQIKELVGLLADEAKDSMLGVTGEELIRAQGGAQALMKLLGLLTKPTPQMQQKRSD